MEGRVGLAVAKECIWMLTAWRASLEHFKVDEFVWCLGIGEMLTNKAIHRLLYDRPPHERWEWVERIAPWVS